MDHPPAVILAGGKATRMGGGDKPLMIWRGRMLVDWVREALEPQVSRIALNANGDPARFDRLGLPVLADDLPDCGPLSGVLTAMTWASAAGASHVLVVAGDTVTLPPDLVARLSPGPAYAASQIDGEWRAHPTVGLWPTSLADGLRSYLISGERRVMGWARSIGAAEVRFDGAVIRNINTPDDLAR